MLLICRDWVNLSSINIGAPVNLHEDGVRFACVDSPPIVPIDIVAKRLLSSFVSLPSPINILGFINSSSFINLNHQQSI